MPVFQGEKVEQQQRPKQVFQGELVQQVEGASTATSVPEGQNQSRPSWMEDIAPGRQPVGGTVGEQARGLGEAGLSLATSSIAEPIAGLAGLWEAGSTALIRDPSADPLERAIQKIESVREALTFRPKTDQGRAILNNLSKDVKGQELMQGARQAGGATLEATGSPGAATAVQTLTEFLPGMFGAEARFEVGGRMGSGFGPSQAPELTPASRTGPNVVDLPATRKARKQDIARVKNAFERADLDLSSEEGMVSSLEEMAARVQEPGFADSLERVRNAVVQSKAVQKALENRLWKQAREGRDSFLSPGQTQELNNYFRQSLEGFNLEQMPTATRIMRNFEEQINPIPGGSGAKISALYRWRQAINQGIGKMADTPEDAALIRLKENLDSYLNAQFATDMIRGDPQSIARWKAAIKQSKQVRETFKDSRVIRQLANQDVTPEEARRLIFNTSSVGAASSARDTLRRLRGILGESSPEFTALRQESMFNLVEPLLSDTPNYQAFTRRYDQFAKRNPAYEEMFTKNAKDEFRSMYAAAKAAQKREPTRRNIKDIIRNSLPVALFGHGIAKAGLKVRAAKNMTDLMIEQRSSSLQREVMSEFLGYEPQIPLFVTPAKRAAAIEAGVQSVSQQQNREE